MLSVSYAYSSHLGQQPKEQKYSSSILTSRLFGAKIFLALSLFKNARKCAFCANGSKYWICNQKNLFTKTCEIFFARFSDAFAWASFISI